MTDRAILTAAIALCHAKGEPLLAANLRWLLEEMMEDEKGELAAADSVEGGILNHERAE